MLCFKGGFLNVLRWCSGGRKLKWGGWGSEFGGGSAAASSGAAASGGLFHASVHSLSPVVICTFISTGNESLLGCFSCTDRFPIVDKSSGSRFCCFPTPLSSAPAKGNP